MMKIKNIISKNARDYCAEIKSKDPLYAAIMLTEENRKETILKKQ